MLLLLVELQRLQEIQRHCHSMMTSSKDDYSLAARDSSATDIDRTFAAWFNFFFLFCRPVGEYSIKKVSCAELSPIACVLARSAFSNCGMNMKYRRRPNTMR